MTPTETAALLRRYNAWRRGSLEDHTMPDPRETGLAIDAAVELIERMEKQEPVAVVDRWLQGRPMLRVIGDAALLPETPLYALPVAQPAPSVPDVWRDGVESAARLIDMKAELYSNRFGHDDMGSLSFGTGAHAEIKMDHYTGLLELAEEVRSTLAAAPKPEAQDTDAGSDPTPSDLLAWGSQAVLDVTAERRRQVQVEGWGTEHDDEHAAGELVAAAACYAAHATGYVWDGEWPSEVWPWNLDSWKPTTPRRDLVKSAALILAEIERIDRAAAQRPEVSDANTE